MVGPSDSFFYSSSTDSSGNIYAVGFIYSNSQYNFGNGITVSGAYASGFNPVIVKYNSSGLAQWARSTVVGPNFSEFNDVSIDSSGDIYVAGYINGNSQYNFGNGVTISGAFTGYNALIVKYNSSGLAQWARSTVVGPKGSEFDSLSIDSSNNIYALGFISDINQYNFGNDVTVSGGYSGSNAVIVKYNSSGLAQWARSTVVGPNNSRFYDSSIDSSGNIYAVGFIMSNSQYNFGNDVTVSGAYTTYNALIVKYNSSGLAQWARSTVVGPNNSSFYSSCVDSFGNIYAVGRIRGSSQYNFGNDVTVSGGSPNYNNALIVKYNSEGLAEWTRSTVVGSDESYFNSSSVDSSGNIYAAGYIYGNDQYNFGNDITISGGYSGYNTAIVKYNSSGLAQWARSTVVGSDYSEFYGSSVDSSGNIYAVGYIYGNSPFGFGNDVTVSGGYDGYNAIIVKYAGEAPPSPPEPEPEPEEDTTPPVFVNLPDIPDTINIKDGQLITTNPYIIKVKPEDDTAISKVEFYVDNNLICTETTSDSQGVYSCFWDTSKYHCFIITVYAYDTSNNRSLALTREAIVDPTLYLIELPKTGREIQCN